MGSTQESLAHGPSSEASADTLMIAGAQPRPLRAPARATRVALGVLGALALGLLILGVSASAASASSHETAQAVGAKGYTLCAAKTGALSFSSSSKCPVGDTTLVLAGQSQNAKLASQVASLTKQVKTLTKKLSTEGAALSSMKTLLHGLSSGVVDGAKTLTISGENLRVVNGTGSESTDNGLGNLLIGYDESPGVQTGSHNLVIGSGQSFSSYGGLLAGAFNSVDAPFATASGGEYNVAADEWASVSGGCDNLAGQGTVPTGECSNQAESVVGGVSNHASGLLSSVLGGQDNVSSGDEASIGGGLNNDAVGTSSSVEGGYANFADNNQTAILGGGENTATGAVSTISGGYYNTATADEATVAGGCSNIAGTGNLTVYSGCYGYGESFMSVLGGVGNQAISVGSTVAGGSDNVVDGGQADSIVGGYAEDLSSSTNYVSRIGSTQYLP